MEKPQSRRYRLAADVPEAMGTRVRETAAKYYAGGLGETINAALIVFDWAVAAKARGKRVIATDPDKLPDAFEEPLIPGFGPEPQWDWLVPRPHAWRRQLWIKGRKITAGSLARSAEIEGWTPERTAYEFDLPVAAVLEAMRYAEQARDLVLAEEAEDRMAVLSIPGMKDGVARLP